MRLLFANHTQNAFQSIRNNRTRSLLTMLGITIGAASITAILSLSSGVQEIISNQVNSLNGNILIIRPGYEFQSDPFQNLIHTNDNTNYKRSSLSENDIINIKKLAHVALVAPLMKFEGTIKGQSVAPISSPILATSSDFIELSKIKLKEGQSIDDSNKPAAVIGTQLSIDIFGTESSVGRIFEIKSTPFNVVGVIEKQNNPINYNNVDLDNSVIINLQNGKLLNQGAFQIQQINLSADSSENIAKIATTASKILTKGHGGEKDYSILYDKQISDSTGKSFYLISIIATTIATISLIVGGIGVMNIMLVTVAERKREIGIRKALGASSFDIAWQFLIESIILSLSGSIAGYIIGYTIALFASSFLTFFPVLNLEIAISVILVSILIGTLFGIYPALKAAGKDPVESLR